MSDDPESPDEEQSDDLTFARGDLVVSLDCPGARISVAAPEGSDPALIERLLDAAVTTIGKLKTQMQ